MARIPILLSSYKQVGLTQTSSDYSEAKNGLDQAYHSKTAWDIARPL